MPYNIYIIFQGQEFGKLINLKFKWLDTCFYFSNFNVDNYCRQGKKKGGVLDKGADASAAEAKFSGAPDAYNKACTELFDEVEEDEE